MTENTKKAEPACDGNCSSCSTASTCDDPAKKAHGIEKVKIDVKHIILVLSGKGGVGTSTVATNLAMSLANKGYNTGIVDLDIHGPNIPKMLGLEDKRLESRDGKTIEPVRLTGNLGVVSMAFLLPDTTSPVVWRGPMKFTAIKQFLEDVNWGDMEYLVVDLPPGTGDEALAIAQLAPNIDGAVIVTTPQDVAVLDSIKAVKFIQQLDLRVIGIIENMSGMVCPHCGEPIDLFGEGGGKKAAEKLNIPFLGTIPLDPEMRKAGDEGRPFIIRKEGDEQHRITWEHVDAVMDNILKEIKK